MPLVERQEIFRQIETERNGRALVCFFNFDRVSTPPIPGISINFSADAKEALFRVLKETVPLEDKVDLCLYTRGGDTNSVWPIASLLREFDPDFEVLVPFRCHSGGTLLALAAKRIIMPALAELSPIDPSTGNQFNPTDPLQPGNRLAISVEDVNAYRDFVISQFVSQASQDGQDDDATVLRDATPLMPFFQRLTEAVHPLALGNVHRAHQQIKQLARNLLGLHPVPDRNLESIIQSLATRFYSHLHMINRHEAREILGSENVEFASNELSRLLDGLLRQYEEDFALRDQFFLNALLENELEKTARFIGGAVESKGWSYLFETRAVLRQHSAIPPNVQVQLPPGQPMPLIPGLPREYGVEVTSQRWARNTEPRGITI